MYVWTRPYIKKANVCKSDTGHASLLLFVVDKNRICWDEMHYQSPQAEQKQNVIHFAVMLQIQSRKAVRKTPTEILTPWLISKRAAFPNQMQKVQC